jgi:phospholipase/lecithinase/hemolysin
MAKYIKDTANNTDIQYVQNDGVHLGTLGHKMISEDIIIPYIAHYETN